MTKTTFKQNKSHQYKPEPLMPEFVTADNLKQFSKIIVNDMVKVLTSKEGYAVMKELSKR